MLDSAAHGLDSAAAHAWDLMTMACGPWYELQLDLHFYYGGGYVVSVAGGLDSVAVGMNRAAAVEAKPQEFGNWESTRERDAGGESNNTV